MGWTIWYKSIRHTWIAMSNKALISDGWSENLVLINTINLLYYIYIYIFYLISVLFLLRIDWRNVRDKLKQFKLITRPPPPCTSFSASDLDKQYRRDDNKNIQIYESIATRYNNNNNNNRKNNNKRISRNIIRNAVIYNKDSRFLVAYIAISLFYIPTIFSTPTARVHVAHPMKIAMAEFYEFRRWPELFGNWFTQSS